MFLIWTLRKHGENLGLQTKEFNDHKFIFPIY